MSTWHCHDTIPMLPRIPELTPRQKTLPLCAWRQPPQLRTSLCLQTIALASDAGTELALPAHKDVFVIFVAALVTLVVARPVPPLEVLARVVLHDVFPLLLHNLCLPGWGLLVESWVLGGFLCRLPGEHSLVKHSAPASSWPSYSYPGLAAYVAEVGAASTGCQRAVRIW